MEAMSEQEQRCGWVTAGMEDGSIRLREPFYSTNHLYVVAHKEWDWQECNRTVAEREVFRQSTGTYPDEQGA
ncbi:hypothetical protein [Burkholderia diffusa]|uniref:hypothetical protein n=1 Tax=Burkholderia diffusa TaxID=488732 RepID=UPI002ABE364F|nr:hypothetical protein [Burkholderia diffusa]